MSPSPSIRIVEEGERHVLSRLAIYCRGAYQRARKLVEARFLEQATEPISILHQTQRASRRLTVYRDQLRSMRTEFAYEIH